MTAGQPSTQKWITTTPTVLEGKPRVQDTRLGVHFLATQVETSDPQTVAERYEIPVEAVRAAVEYYRSNPETMASIERQRDALFEEAETHPAIPTTPAELEAFATNTRSPTQPMTDDSIESLRADIETVRQAVREDLAADFGGDPGDYRAEKPLPGGG